MNLKENKPTYQQGDEVHIMIWSQSELGYNVIVDRRHMGLIYNNQLYKKVQVGQTMHLHQQSSFGWQIRRQNESICVW